jgi:uncharacterized protein with HEPN domain
MLPDARDAGYLWDILEASRIAQALAAGLSLDEFQADPRVHLSVAHAIQIVGEAASHISDGFQQAHPEIPWRAIVGQRNVIVHGYRDLDYAQIWTVVTIDLPQLIAAASALLPPLSPEDDP